MMLHFSEKKKKKKKKNRNLIFVCRAKQMTVSMWNAIVGWNGLTL